MEWDSEFNKPEESKVNLTHLRALVDETVAQALTGVRGTNEATSLPSRVHEAIQTNTA